MTRVTKGRVRPSSSLLLTAARLPSAGNLTPVAAEGEFLDEIGDGLAHREEFNFNVPVGCHVRDPAGQPE
ncbi:MAG TPA: hypothetical protein VGO18_13460, partial [Steroidobacteraceae bacterium]|nr:hypothetical protein [Steroidobacteraceae bacterium]